MIKVFVFDLTGRCYGMRKVHAFAVNIGGEAEIGWVLAEDLPQFRSAADVPNLSELGPYRVEPNNKRIFLGGA